MKLSDQYRYNDFTEKNYRYILEQLLKEYEFSKYDYEKIFSDKKIVLLRHDLDTSLLRAVRLAEIEKEYQIQSTYFIYLQSTGYNIFEAGQYKAVMDIMDKGHEIGLHFDYGFCKQCRNMKTRNEIEQCAVEEKELLEKLFGIKIRVMSFHNPVFNNILSIQDDYFAGMINAYSKTISENCKYCSDSYGYWKYDRLMTVMEELHDKLQILLHPEWWTPTPMSPYERYKRLTEGRAAAMMNVYSDMMIKSGRDNIYYEE
ncbi:MAG: hypothetical protein K2K90_01025 [Lachnospiraceae bacterium]|nr:hypothetical protein [Lachnospiraceae bacterium]